MPGAAGDVNWMSIALPKLPIFTMPGTTRDETMKLVRNLPFSFGLRVRGPRLTDEGLMELGRLTNLTYLDLRLQRVSVNVARELGKLKKLGMLDLQGTRLTNEGLKEVCRLDRKE